LVWQAYPLYFCHAYEDIHHSFGPYGNQALQGMGYQEYRYFAGFQECPANPGVHQRSLF